MDNEFGMPPLDDALETPFGEASPYTAHGSGVEIVFADEYDGEGEEFGDEESGSYAGSEYADDDQEEAEGYKPGGYHPVRVSARLRYN